MQCRIKSPASRLFTLPFIQAQIKEYIKAPRHWPLCGEFPVDRWIPRSNDQQRGKCFIWWSHHVKYNYFIRNGLQEIAYIVNVVFLTGSISIYFTSSCNSDFPAYRFLYFVRISLWLMISTCFVLPISSGENIISAPGSTTYIFINFC